MQIFQPDNKEGVIQCRERLKIAVEKVGVLISSRSCGLNPVARDPENPLVILPFIDFSFYIDCYSLHYKLFNNVLLQILMKLKELCFLTKHFNVP